ncbi:Glycine betaine methyltransferase [anaerobic digester metagenome]
MNQNQIKFQVLKEEQCRDIVDAAMTVLEKTGCDIHNEKALAILRDAGCGVEGIRVRIPAWLIKDCLATAPSAVNIYDRKGNKAFTLDAHSFQSYYVAGLLNLYRVDSETGERRLTVTKDVRDAGLVIDALPNIDVASGLAYIVDCDPTVADLYELRELLAATTKPILLWNFDADGFEDEMQMCATVAGGMDQLIKKPFIIAGGSPSPPLAHAEEVMDKMMAMFRYGVPTPYVCGPMVGASAPVTLAGACVVGLADSFVGLVLSQLINKGCPFLGACFVDYMDLRTMAFAQTSPEMMLGSAASGDLYRYLDLPYACHFGTTDSPAFDQQAAADISTQLYTGMLSGANLNFFIGYLEGAMSSSLEALVFGNEVIDLLRHVQGGFEVNTETLAVDVIDHVGPSGNFLAEEHTLNHFRENWVPQDFIRVNYETWKAEGKKDFFTRANEKVKAIIERGIVEPLPAEVSAKLDEIIAVAEKRRGIR